jgi:hypothetical protein
VAALSHAGRFGANTKHQLQSTIGSMQAAEIYSLLLAHYVLAVVTSGNRSDNSSAMVHMLLFSRSAAGPFARGFTSLVNLQRAGTPLPAAASPPTLSQPSVVAQQAALAALAGE